MSLWWLDPDYDLIDRISALIDFWRDMADDAGDEGSIYIMADQLERCLEVGP